jgi:hypothetical protein
MTLTSPVTVTVTVAPVLVVYATFAAATVASHCIGISCRYA